MSKLTEAQRSYMEAAALHLLTFSSVKGGSSVKCVNHLANAGLLARDFDRKEWRITDKGREALKDAQ